jgi:16S rRNA processing protein RimM
VTESTESAKESEDTDPLVLVGEITAPFGIRGQVKMRPLIEQPKALAKLPSVRLRYPGGREESRRVSEARPHQGAAVLTLEGIGDRDASELLRDVLVFIRRSELPPLGDDAYYEGQLVGLRVVTESGRDLGAIEQVLFGPANDVYETADALIPAVGDVVVEVDLPGGRMVVRDIPGLRKDE